MNTTEISVKFDECGNETDQPQVILVIAGIRVLPLINLVAIGGVNVSINTRIAAVG